MRGFPAGTGGKETACECRGHRRCRFSPWVGKIPWKRKWQPTPIFLPEKIPWQRSLVGYSSWDYKESTDCAHTHTSTKWQYSDAFVLILFQNGYY